MLSFWRYIISVVVVASAFVAAIHCHGHYCYCQRVYQEPENSTATSLELLDAMRFYVI